MRAAATVKALRGISVSIELATSAALMSSPSFVCRLLLGVALPPAGEAVGRLCAVALLSLCLACWPSSSGIRGLVVYNALAAVLLGRLWLGGQLVGVVLVPAVAVHAVMALLLALAWRQSRRTVAARPATAH